MDEQLTVDDAIDTVDQVVSDNQDGNGKPAIGRDKVIEEATRRLGRPKDKAVLDALHKRVGDHFDAPAE